jgi:hypothetical protein
MKLLIISASAAVALFAATMLPSLTGNPNRAGVTPVTISSQDLQSAVDVKKLPVHGKLNGLGGAARDLKREWTAARTVLRTARQDAFNLLPNTKPCYKSKSVARK